MADVTPPVSSRAARDYNLGTMALEEGGRVDFARMRRQRFDAVITAMGSAGIDALVLGREANARYASGVHRLWTAGSRPFGPGCVVVGATRQVHLLSTWDDGVPEEIARRNLFSLSWNPAVYARALGEIPSLAEARTIGVDGSSRSAGAMLAGLAPNATLVDVQPMMLDLRRVKTADEIWCLRTAVRLAEASLSHAISFLTPGVTEKELLGRSDERMAQLGTTVPAAEGTFCVTPASQRPGQAGLPVRQLPSYRAVDGGDLVAMAPAVLYAGYEGSLARTWPCPLPDRGPTAAQHDLARRWASLWSRLSEALAPGGRAGALNQAYEASGEPPPPVLIAHGVGLGTEPPLVGPGVPADAGASTVLRPGMVLSVGGYVWESGVGGYLAAETVLITESGFELLTSHSHGPLAR